jgi:hypothetical protein
MIQTYPSIPDHMTREKALVVALLKIEGDFPDFIGPVHEGDTLATIACLCWKQEIEAWSWLILSPWARMVLTPALESHPYGTWLVVHAVELADGAERLLRIDRMGNGEPMPIPQDVARELLSTLKDVVQRLEVCALAGGNDPECVAAMLSPARTVMARAEGREVL